MLKGQPDNAHVGRMYTRAQEQEFDAYYERVTGSHIGNMFTAAQEREFNEYYERVMGRRPWETLEELEKRDTKESFDNAFVGARTRDDAQYGRCFGNWW